MKTGQNLDGHGKPKQTVKIFTPLTVDDILENETIYLSTFVYNNFYKYRHFGKGKTEFSCLASSHTLWGPFFKTLSAPLVSKMSRHGTLENIPAEY